MAPPTLLTLIRHGETAANLEGVWHGSTDTPLTARGQRQAERLGRFAAEKLADARALYASDLQRAHDTARPLERALALPIRLDTGLREYHLGAWEGRSYLELHEQHRLWHHMKRDPDFAPHGGESPRQVTERFLASLHRIASAHPGDRVLVVAHGGALAMALGALLDGSYGSWRRVMDNCAVTELALAEPPELVSFNRKEHLEGV